MKNILVIILMLISKIGVAQLDFKIENIIITRIIEELDGNIVHEDFGEGPGIAVYCYIINNSSDTIILYPSSSKLDIIFTFKNNKHYNSVTYNPYLFRGIDSLTIFPNQIFDFNFYDNYLLGTDFYKWNKISLPDSGRIDHTKEVIATLPTLRVRYRDKNIDIITDEIKNVTVGR